VGAADQAASEGDAHCGAELGSTESAAVWLPVAEVGEGVEVPVVE